MSKENLIKALSNCAVILNGYMVMFNDLESKPNADLQKKLGLDVDGLKDDLFSEMSESWAKWQKKNEIKPVTLIDQFVRECIDRVSKVELFLDFAETVALEQFADLRKHLEIFQKYIGESLGENVELKNKLSEFKKQEDDVYEKLNKEMDEFQVEFKTVSSSETKNSNLRP
jgi:adenylate kinase family enzyme